MDSPARVRAVLIAVGALILLHGVLCWMVAPVAVSTGQDDAMYVLLGRALAQGSYRELYRVGTPVHAMYPPGYPAALAVWGVVAGHGFRALVLLNVVASAGILALVFAAFRRVFSIEVGLLAVAVLAVNPAMVDYGSHIASETPYMLASLGALLLLASPRPGRKRLVAAGSLAILAALTRSVGVVLLAAILVHWVLERRWKAVLIFGLACALTVGAWLVWTAVAPDQFEGRSYVADALAGDRIASQGLLGLAARIMRRARYYMTQAVPWNLAFPTIEGTLLDNLAGLAVLVTTVGTGIVVMLKRWRAAALLVVVHLALLTYWIWIVDRFIVPLIPLLVGAMLGGAWWLGRRLNVRWGLPAVLVVAVTLVASGFGRTLGAVEQQSGCSLAGDMPGPECLSGDEAGYYQALRYVRTNLPEDAIVLTAKSAPLYYYTGRRTVMLQAALRVGDDGLTGFLRSHRVDYVLLAHLFAGELGLSRRLNAHCEQYVLEAYFPTRTYLFRVRQPGERGGEKAACAAIAAYRDVMRDPGLFN